MDTFKCALQHFVGDFCQTALWRSSQSFFLMYQVEFTGAPRREWVMPDYNTGKFMPYSLRIVCGFFNVPQLLRVVRWDLRFIVRPYPRRLGSLTICWCNYKGSTFYSVILRPWALVPRSWTHDLPRHSPMLNQLSHRCAVVAYGGSLFFIKWSLQVLQIHPFQHFILILHVRYFALSSWDSLSLQAFTTLCLYLSWSQQLQNDVYWT